jgi:AcrR family transcriptional regulator
MYICSYSILCRESQTEMKAKPKHGTTRRQPQQRRSLQTVEAVLDAVVKVLKREGVQAVTTNRIAEVAGVSIGSVYQYFPDKRAIFLALHDRHAEKVGRVIESTLVDHAASSLEELLRALLEAIVDAHAPDPELFQLLHTDVPHRADGARQLEGRLRGVLRLALSGRLGELKRPSELEKTLFVVAHMLDSLSHAVVLGRPPQLSLGAAKEEAVRAILAYLRA